MDKKNTMLLTVIAVATLLVAVVGATFAYFSVANATDSTVQANVQTGKIPTVTVSSEHPNLYLNVTATDMANDGVPKYYYAKDASCGGDTITSCYTAGEASPDTSNYIDIFKVKIDGSDNDVNYTCNGTIKVTSDSLADINELTATDITIGLKGYNDQDDDTTIDAYTVKENNSDGVTQDLSFKFSGNGEKTIKAYVLLTNRDQDQSYLAGKNLKFSIKAESVKCTIDAAAD